MTDASRTSTSPWSNSVTLVGAWAPAVVVLARRRHPKVGCLTGDTQRLKPLRSGALGHGAGHVDDRLSRLADRQGRDDPVGQRIDGGQLVGILQPDIDASAVARWPNPVRQLADRYCRNQAEVGGAEHLYLVEAADRDIGELAIALRTILT